jgi:hypothetical protein
MKDRRTVPAGFGEQIFTPSVLHECLNMIINYNGEKRLCLNEVQKNS